MKRHTYLDFTCSADEHDVLVLLSSFDGFLLSASSRERIIFHE